MKYLKDFFHEEDAVETMEWIAIITVAAALIVIVSRCGTKIKSKLSGIASAI